MADDQVARTFLRHTLATVAYRGGKALRGAPPGFASFRVREGSRTPGEILAHLGDLFDWALTLATGAVAWHNSTPQAWDRDVDRFFAALAKLDAYLATEAPLACLAGQLFQGPIADALTHVGQLTMLRRVSGSPVRGENYFKASIAAGRVGAADQAPPRAEFD